MKREFEVLFTDEIKELTKLNLPDPETLYYYKRMANREIYWNADIYDDLVDVTLDILNWNKEDKGIPVNERKPIKILINSDGGDLSAVLNVIDAIKLSKTPVYTIGLAKTYSSGGLLLISGHKRFIFSNTTFLLHDGSTGAMGDTGKVFDRFEFSQKQEEKVKEYILTNTKIDAELYEKNYRKDWWLFADDIIKYGIADKVITDLDDIL